MLFRSDWFIGTTPLTGGIPEEIRNLTLTFAYNDIASVEKLFSQYPNDIACLIMEVVTTAEPKDNFLHKVQALCQKNGTVFILDEMVTGFRYGFPGVQKKYGLTPDLSTYGKGIANGFSLAVLAGKKAIMELGGLYHKKERVFLISTTHGAETTALAAGLAAIKEMKIKKVTQAMAKHGETLRRGLQSLIKSHNLEPYLEVFGFPCNLAMNFKDYDDLPSWLLRTIFLQEVIRRGVLFQGYFAISYSHGPREIKDTLEIFDQAISAYKQAFADTVHREKYLIGEVIKPVFRKYN